MPNKSYNNNYTIYKYTLDMSNRANVLHELEQEYLASLSEKERMGYEIAKDHLGSTFHLQKSNGFIAWFKKKKAESLVEGGSGAGAGGIAGT